MVITCLQILRCASVLAVSSLDQIVLAQRDLFAHVHAISTCLGGIRGTLGASC
jgi:hypothetical protein